MHQFHTLKSVSPYSPKKTGRSIFSDLRLPDSTKNPIGLAFQRVREERPDLKLTSDGEHAGIYGKYLTINVLYATLFGGNPIDLAYLPEEFEEISEEDAAYLQRIALETVLEYQD